MQNLAKKLIDLRGTQGASQQIPSAIFGSIGTIGRNLDNREQIRIGLWPIISDEQPETAMGIATILAFLLERWREIRVYRLFSQLTGTPDDYGWSIEKSQFGVDDWDLTHLDENVALWGTLSQKDGHYDLKVEIENDLAEEADEETAIFTLSAPSLADLINKLPLLVTDIANELDAETDLFGAYTETAIADETLHTLLAALFKWQNSLLLALWGQSWDQAQINADIDHLVKIGGDTEDQFAVWGITNALAHALQPGYAETAETVSRQVPTIVQSFEDNSFAAIFLGSALFRLGRTQQAYDMLETEVTTHPNNISSWIALGEIYRAGGRFESAADALQRAIEAKATNATLYLRYVDLLGAFYNQGIELQEFTLIDPDKYAPDDSQLMAWEAIEGFEAALSLEPDNIMLLQRQCLQLIAVRDTERLWNQLEKLIKLDQEGEASRFVMDALYPIEDLEPAIELLETAIENEPNRPDLHLNLAIVYIINEEEEAALKALDRAEELTDDPHLIAEMDRLFLIAEDPNFEAYIAELTTLVNSGGKLTSTDIDYLEDAIERAPSLAELYLLLAKGYAALNEHEDALEVLMDGHKEAPDDPDILLELSRILWGSDQKELAFEYLNKGLAANPGHVPLLSTIGLYLFENDQPDEARTYLLRAESISPQSRALAEARREISRQMSERD